MTGKDLKDFRESLSLTQEDLSKLLGVALNTVSRWELETRPIPSYLHLALETIKRNLEK